MIELNFAQQLNEDYTVCREPFNFIDFVSAASLLLSSAKKSKRIETAGW